MLHDSQTDLVFLPMALRLHFPRLYKSLTKALETAHVEHQEIPHTESKTRLWVRDYMPITVDTHGDIAQFCYDPDYLRAPRYNKYKPDMALIWNELGITPFRYEDITLDGGNVITDKQGQVYMTDKIFQENDFAARKKLVAELKNRLDASAIQIVQWDKSDIYGHVDGIMAIADDGSLITDLSWEYLNFLRVGNNIFMAQLGEPTDEPALRRIQEAYPDCTVYSIKYVKSLTRLGGGLHCATWNTAKNAYQNAKVFKTSKRHPFNPFDKDAFTEERLRAVVEYYERKKLSDDEWNALNIAFYSYWNRIRRDKECFAFWDMVHSMHVTVAEQGPYFHERDRLASICDAITSYIMSIPGLIPPSNSEYHSPIVDTDGHIRITLDEFKQILDSDLDEETLRAILS